MAPVRPDILLRQVKHQTLPLYLDSLSPPVEINKKVFKVWAGSIETLKLPSPSSEQYSKRFELNA